MSWSKTGKRNGKYAIWSETLTVLTSDSAGQDLYSSEINFIPPGQDFIVFANTDATSLSSGGDIAVVCSFESGTADASMALLKDDLITSINNKVAAAVYDVSANGDAPYYKLFVDSDGVQKATDTITLKIVVPNKMASV